MNKNSELLKSMASHSLILGGFSLVAALLLSVVKISSAEKIEQQKIEAERLALYQVLPPAQHNNDLLNASFTLGQSSETFSNIELLALSENHQAYVASLNGDISGFILPSEAHDGYSGDILMLVGINANGTISGVRILSHKETPGLGDKLDLRVSDWILSFNNHSLSFPEAPQWQVKKDGGNFDQFVGATITPRAVVKAVKNALHFFEENRTELLAINTTNTKDIDQ